MNNIIAFVCVEETTLSGNKNSTKKGEIVYVDVIQWKNSNFINLYATDKPGKYERLGIGKSCCFLPLSKWREKQINEILND